jgi:hypothetical protein
MMSKYSIGLLLCSLFPTWGHAQTGAGESPTKATLCELYQHPEQFAGKIVSVRASVAGNDLWIDTFEQKACSSWMNVVVVLPEQVKPAPGFSLLHDDSLTTLLKSVRQGKGVQATFEGRFDAAFIWRDHKRIPVGTDPGYGKKNRYGGRIVLQRVSDVLVLPGSRL